MLRVMTIKNIALIENLSIHFEKGLHILSGETGAGKSIVVDAVNLLLGSRADRELIRSGEEKAYVEAFFDVKNNSEAQGFLIENQIETDYEEVVVSREISLTGKNICRIGGIPMSLSLFKSFTNLIMNIHGQHEHQFLLDTNFQLHFLDEFGGKTQEILLKKTEEAYNLWREGNKKWKELKSNTREKEQRMDTLRFQIEELNQAQLKLGEEELLRQERDAFRNNQKIQNQYHLLYGSFFGEENHDGAIQLIEKALEALEEVTAFLPEKKEDQNQLQTLFYDLENLGEKISKEYHQLEFDPVRFDEIEERLDLLRKLERKYGNNTEEIIAYHQKISKEYEELLHLEENLEAEKEKQIKLLRNYRSNAKELSLARKILAQELEKKMEEQLKDLGMGNTRFVVCFEEKKTDKPQIPQRLGEDEILFLIAPNLGEPLQSLSKTASGGELSRLMLAIKSLTAQGSFAGTMIFDEIDTGISGNIAWVVGEKMAKIAKFQQVICVTHLAQIAAMADQSYLVEKFEANERTRTTVKLLNEKEKIQEVARLIGGVDERIENTGVSHALSILKAAKEIKEKI